PIHNITIHNYLTHPDLHSFPTRRSSDLLYKYVIKNVAKKHGKTATFMPKPLFADNGSGMHTHQSLWKKNKPLFAGNEYAGLSNLDRKSTRLNSSHQIISYAVFCLKRKQH